MNASNEQRRKSQSGFTLIETLTTISIFALIMVALVSALLYFYRTNSYSVEQAFAVDNGRRGVETLVRDLREAVYSAEGSYPIVSADDDSITFYSDIEGSPLAEKLTYRLSNDALVRDVTEAAGDPPSYTSEPTASSTISSYVRNEESGLPLFTYYDEDGNLVSDLSQTADIVFIRVSLKVNVNPNRLPNEFVIRGSATLRNIKNTIE